MTDTNQLWAGAFGAEYLDRNNPRWEDRVPFWRDLLQDCAAESFLDVGCNRGYNLMAIRSLNAEYTMSGIDINADAVKAAVAQGLDVTEGRADQVADLFGEKSADMVITSGVLIHIAPEDLRSVMGSIVAASKKWVVAIEYEADAEVEVPYRGQSGALWKRPFGRLYQELGLQVVEYHPVAVGYDQCAAWIMEKQ